MKNIEIDEALYQYIAANTQFIGESASDILRRLLNFDNNSTNDVKVDAVAANTSSKDTSEGVLDETENSELIADNTANEDEHSHESVFDFINKEELAMQRGAVGRFLLILAALHRAHSKQFHVVNEICGTNRLYFANSESALTESGSSTKPRQISGSNYWVITNSNTTRKKMMLTKAASLLGYSQDDVEAIRELL
ncbi:MAG: replication initiation negative regulator SeqA [Colwellia sp.]